MRIWVRYLITILALMSPICNLTAGWGYPSQTLAHPSSGLRAHSELCHCSNCAGGSACCCTRVLDGVQGSILRAACDGHQADVSNIKFAWIALPRYLECMFVVHCQKLHPWFWLWPASDHIIRLVEMPPE